MAAFPPIVANGLNRVHSGRVARRAHHDPQQAAGGNPACFTVYASGLSECTCFGIIGILPGRAGIAFFDTRFQVGMNLQRKQ